MEYSFKKSMSERYDIRFGKWGWAIITIDENGGIFNCQSDYGDYSYSWGNHGRKSFKHFLIDICRDHHYFLKKVANEDYFDFWKNQKEWKKKIIELRKEREITKEQAIEVWKLIHELEDYSNDASIVAKMLYDNAVVWEICPEPYYYFEIKKEYHPRVLGFANEVLPRFREILQNEINN